MSAHQARAWLLMQQGRWELADREWRGALAEQPEDAEAHGALALCLLNRDLLDEAEHEADEAVRLDPAADAGHGVRARVLLERRRYADAMTAIDEAIRIDPADVGHRGVQAEIHAAKDAWQECLDAADAGLAIDPEHHRCVNLRALALTHLDRRDEASATMADALARTPDNSLTHANQGWTLLHQDDSAKALDHFREALRLDADNSWARSGLVTALKAQNAVYRRILAWFLFLARMKKRYAWGMMLGMGLAENKLGGFLRANPEQGWWGWPLHAAVFVFFMLSWLADPLGNLALRFHPIGRYALTREQQLSSTLVIGGMALVLGIGLSGWVIGQPPRAITMNFLFLALCVSAAFDCEAGWPRRWGVWLAGLTGVLVIGSALVLAFRGHFLTHHDVVSMWVFLGAIAFLFYAAQVLLVLLIAICLLSLATPKK